MNYDKSIDELEKIVQRLSNEKMNLEEGLKLYADGIKIAKSALDELNSFKGSIEMLNKDLSALEAEFDETMDDDSDDTDEDDE